MYPTLQLKPMKEASVAYGHPWIFTGAFVALPESIPHGSFVHVADRKGEVIATGSFSRGGSIAVRVFGKGTIAIDRALIEARLRAANDRRTQMGYGPGTDTTGYRACYGESDLLPGLVIDVYGDTAVMQISTASMDAMREDIIAAILGAIPVKNIAERSDMIGRKEEHLEASTGIRAGSVTGPITFKEKGIEFVADVLEGQKTGFFMDQKNLRSHIKRYAKGANVLNLFSYSGSAGIAAMLGGATRVHNVDGSVEALELCKKNAALHDIDLANFTTEEADLFKWLSDSEGQYDMVLIDPPAIIKSQKDTEAGMKAYHFVNRAAMKLVKDGGIFVTSSCSHHMSEEDFAFMLRRASVQADTRLHVIDTARQSPDHPVSVYFPEAAYLKSFVCKVEKV